MTKVQTQLVQVAAKRFKLYSASGTVAVEYEKILVGLFAMHSARDPVERLVRSIVGHSVEAFNLFVSQVGT